MEVGGNMFMRARREVNIHETRIEYKTCVDNVNDYIARCSTDLYDSANSSLTYVERREAIMRYIAELSAATRSHEMIRLGVSPRGSLALCNAVRATALVRGRDYVVPDDIRVVIRECFAHRLLLQPRARVEKVTADALLEDILSTVPVPKLQRKHES